MSFKKHIKGVFFSDKLENTSIKELRKKYVLLKVYFFSITLILLSILTLLALKFIPQSLYADKLIALRNEITCHYYDQDKLNDIMKETLKSGFTDNKTENFNNFVLSLVTKTLAEKESDKWKPYNYFASPQNVKKLEKMRKEKAELAEYKKFDDKTYYINFKNFVSGITYKEFESRFKEMSNFNSLLIDLRDNPGGSTEEVKKVAEAFLDKGQTIFQEKFWNKTVKYKAERLKTLNFKKIVILVNSGTASSAEILTLSLKENLKNVTIIGTETYGKGIGTYTRDFYDGSALSYINFYWNGPSGRNIHGSGISPDIYEKAPDMQVKKAREILF